MKISVLITCHNRRAKTLSCLESLYNQERAPNVEIETWLVDDGSSDGTAEAVSERFKGVRIIRGNGSLFWCGGMNLAWRHAQAGNPDYFFWLNDDVSLRPGALGTLLRGTAAHPDSIIVGACASPNTEEIVYGGLKRAGRHPGSFKLIGAAPEAVTCDSFHGNVVLVPRTVWLKIGTMTNYTHCMGDFDYGFKARRAKISIWQLAEITGECSFNQGALNWRDRSLPFSRRWALVTSVKVMAPKDWLRYCTRNAGITGIVYFATPYLRVLFRR